MKIITAKSWKDTLRVSSSSLEKNEKVLDSGMLSNSNDLDSITIKRSAVSDLLVVVMCAWGCVSCVLCQSMSKAVLYLS